MPRPARIVFIIAALILISVAGWYIWPQWTQKDPLAVRVLEYRRLRKDRAFVKYEVENTSPYDVRVLTFFEFHGAHLAGRFHEIGYWAKDDWEGRTFQLGSRMTFDTEFALADADASSPQYFVYAWDPIPVHSLRKLIPALRQNLDSGTLSFRMGSDGPFILTDKDVSRTQP